MWKKNEPEVPATPSSSPTPSVTAPKPAGESSVLGASLVVRGDISGTQDLVIRGKVEGTVKMKDNTVTVGDSGRVKADIYGKTVVIEGELSGNLYGGEKVVVRASGTVRGNISSPRVTLEDGARFKGSIDMEGAKAQTRKEEAPAKPAAKKDDKPGVKPDDPTPVAGMKKAEKPGVGQMQINASTSNT